MQEHFTRTGRTTGYNGLAIKHKDVVVFIIFGRESVAFTALNG